MIMLFRSVISVRSVVRLPIFSICAPRRNRTFVERKEAAGRIRRGGVRPRNPTPAAGATRRGRPRDAVGRDGLSHRTEAGRRIDRPMIGIDERSDEGRRSAGRTGGTNGGRTPAARRSGRGLLRPAGPTRRDRESGKRWISIECPVNPAQYGGARRRCSPPGIGLTRSRGGRGVSGTLSSFPPSPRPPRLRVRSSIRPGARGGAASRVESATNSTERSRIAARRPAARECQRRPPKLIHSTRKARRGIAGRSRLRQRPEPRVSSVEAAPAADPRFPVNVERFRALLVAVRTMAPSARYEPEAPASASKPRARDPLACASGS